MIVSRISIENFRGLRKAEIDLTGHAHLIGPNSVGKSTAYEVLELVGATPTNLRKW